MRKKLSITKHIGGFAPELHWDIILMCIAILTIGLSGYIGFMYVTFDSKVQHIENASVVGDTNSHKDEQALKKIINMESVIVGYREKERAYKDLLKALAVRAPASIVVASSTTSSVVASSSLR